MKGKNLNLKEKKKIRPERKRKNGKTRKEKCF